MTTQILYTRSEQNSHHISKKTLSIILGLTLGFGLLLSLLAFYVFFTRRRESRRQILYSESIDQLTESNDPNSFYMVESSTGILVERPKSSLGLGLNSPESYRSSLRRSGGYQREFIGMDHDLNRSSSTGSNSSGGSDFWKKELSLEEDGLRLDCIPYQNDPSAGRQDRY